MNNDFFINKYEAYKETNRILSFCLIIMSVCFCVTVYYIYSIHNNQKIVIIPPGADTRMEISYNSIDTNTLKLWSKYIASLFLNYTPSTYADQAHDLLKLTTPQYYNQLESVLLDNKKDIENLKVSSTFFPESIEINSQKNELTMKGYRFLIVEKEPITRKEEIYIFRYKITNGKFHVDGIFQGNQRG